LQQTLQQRSLTPLLQKRIVVNVTKIGFSQQQQQHQQHHGTDAAAIAAAIFVTATAAVQ
jgi:hypothetical protein